MFVATTITRRTAAVAAGLAIASAGLATASADAKPPKAPQACGIAIPADSKQVDVRLSEGGTMRLIEVSANGKRDFVLLDLDADRQWDAGAADCDLDGTLDHRWLDRTGHSGATPGNMKRIKRSVKVGKGCRVTKRVARKACRSHPQWILGLRALPKGFPVAAAQPSKPQPAPAPAPAPAPQPVHPDPTPQPKPQPPSPRTPMNIQADVNGDGHLDPIFGDTTLTVFDSAFVHAMTSDEVTVGTKDGAKVVRVGNVDGAYGEDEEVVIEDPTVEAKYSGGIDLDGDGDNDAIVAGTKDGAKITVANMDADPTDVDVYFEDPTLPASMGWVFDIDSDGDYDISGSGTKM
jgi:hypothetical protein